MSGAERSAGHVRMAGMRVRLGSGTQAFDAVRDIDLDVEPGSFVCLLGPSGCGKSTLLGTLAGHLFPSAGTVELDGKPVTGPHPERGLVFQQHTLFPWLKVIDNVAFGPKMQGVGRAERREQARAILDLVGLGDFADHYPSQLSGGMQQRAEIARVLINRPRVLLMDEPFGALDALIRAQMQRQLLDAWTKVHTTVLFITHDVDEALFLADRVLVMSARPGRIIADFRPGFARPRESALLTAPAFTELKRQCIELLGNGIHNIPLERLTPLGRAEATRKSAHA